MSNLIDYTDSVNAAKAGDMDAFAFLYNQSFGILKPECMKYFKSPADVDDALQEAYIRIYNNIAQLEDPRAFIGWARTLTRNTCLNMIRSRERKQGMDEFRPMTSEEDKEGMDTISAEEYRREYVPEESMDMQAISELVQQMLGELPELQRASILLWNENYTYREIGEQLGIPEGTAKSNVNYAKKKIAKMTEELEKKQGIKLHGVAPIPFFLWLLKQFGNYRAGKPAQGSAASYQSIQRNYAAQRAASETAQRTAQRGAGEVSREAVQRSSGEAAQRTAQRGAADVSREAAQKSAGEVTRSAAQRAGHAADGVGKFRMAAEAASSAAGRGLGGISFGAIPFAAKLVAGLTAVAVVGGTTAGVLRYQERKQQEQPPAAVSSQSVADEETSAQQEEGMTGAAEAAQAGDTQSRSAASEAPSEEKLWVVNEVRFKDVDGITSVFKVNYDFAKKMMVVNLDSGNQNPNTYEDDYLDINRTWLYGLVDWANSKYLAPMIMDMNFKEPDVIVLPFCNMKLIRDGLIDRITDSEYYGEEAAAGGEYVYQFTTNRNGDVTDITNRFVMAGTQIQYSEGCISGYTQGGSSVTDSLKDPSFQYDAQGRLLGGEENVLWDEDIPFDENNPPQPVWNTNQQGMPTSFAYDGLMMTCAYNAQGMLEKIVDEDNVPVFELRYDENQNVTYMKNGEMEAWYKHEEVTVEKNQLPDASAREATPAQANSTANDQRYAREISMLQERAHARWFFYDITGDGSDDLIAKYSDAGIDSGTSVIYSGDGGAVNRIYQDESGHLDRIQLLGGYEKGYLYVVDDRGMGGSWRLRQAFWNGTELQYEDLYETDDDTEAAEQYYDKEKLVETEVHSHDNMDW